MRTITKTVYLCEDEYGNQQTFAFDATSQGYITLAKQDVTFEIPDDLNIVALKVAAIDKRIEATQREYGSQLQRLKDAKAKLLCIENGVSA